MPVRSFNSLTTWLKIALVCLLLGVLTFVIGFATYSWQTYGRYWGRGVRHLDSIGLWEALDSRGDVVKVSGRGDSRIQAAQALETIGLVLQLLGLIIFLLYSFVDSCRRREGMIATIVCLFGAVFFMVIGIVLVDSRWGGDVGWSMGIACAGCVLTFLSGVFCLLHYCGVRS